MCMPSVNDGPVHGHRSAQIRLPNADNPQVSVASQPRIPDREPSPVSALC